MDSISTSMDKKSLIHIAAEVVIVGGVTIWLNSKINGESARIDKLEKENAELKQRLERIEQFLSSSPQPSGPPPAPRRRPPRREEVGTESEDEEVISSDDEEIAI